MKKILTIKELMNKIAPFYDKICSPCSNERITYLKQLIKDNSISTFLDLSCSTGQTINNLKDCSCLFYGIDLSKKMINVARAKTNQFRNIHFYHTDMITFLKNTTSKFDCIYSNSLNWLPSLNDFSLVIKLCANKLSTNGILLIDIPIDSKTLNQSASNCVVDNCLIIKNTLMTKVNTYQVKVIQEYSLIKNYTYKSYFGEFSLINFNNKLLCDTINNSPFYILKRDVNYNNPANTLYHQLVLKKRDLS